MPTGRILKFSNPQDENDFVYLGSINPKIRDVVANWRKLNESLPWAQAAAYVILEEEFKDITTKEIRKIAAEKEEADKAALAMQIPKEVVEEVATTFNDLQPCTLKQYQSEIEKFYLFHKENWNTLLVQDFKRADEYAKSLNVKETYNFYCALSKYQSVVAQRNTREMTKRIQIARQNEMKVKIEKLKENKQEAATFTMQDLRDQRDKIKDKTGMDYLILSLLTLIPPKRPETLATIAIKNMGDVQHNYLNLETGLLKLHHTKTVRYQGKKEQQLPPELMETVRAFVVANKISDWLIGKSGNTLSTYIRRLIKHSSNEIRHVFISEAIKEGKDISALAWEMDSSATTALLVYGNLQPVEE